MNRKWLIAVALMAGLIVGTCAAILVVPELAQTQFGAGVDVSAYVPDHGQGTTRITNNQTTNNQVLTVDYNENTPLSKGDGGISDSVSVEFLDAAFKAKYDWSVPSGTRILLIPHHLVAAREIASLVSATPKPKVVYLVVPDHFSECRVGICVQWFDKEHALTGLTPFMRRAWGDNVEIQPFVVSPDLSSDRTKALTAFIVDKLKKDPNALLAVSIDASHYLPAWLADFHDKMTADVLTGLADMEVQETEIDAPAVLRVGLRAARELGLGNVTIHGHTNSLRILKAEIAQDSTSHFYASFAPGKIQPQKIVTLLAVGDMMFDRNVAARIKSSGADNYAFKNILGLENRFFRGQDIVVGNLEGPVATKRGAPNKGEVDFMFDPKFVAVLKKVGFDAVSQANNHSNDQGAAAAISSRDLLSKGGLTVFGDQYNVGPDVAYKVIERRGKKIALVGFDATSKKMDREAAGKTLVQARAAADFVVVFPHWGTEYQAKPNKEQIDLAHWFVDNGADAIIGSHPHWMQSVEVYKNRPIAYSLGNFVFDQDWSTETDLGLAVGLVLTEKGSKLHLFPIKIEKSQPKLLTGKERQARLDRLASISDKSLSSQIKNGVLTSIK